MLQLLIFWSYNRLRLCVSWRTMNRAVCGGSTFLQHTTLTLALCGMHRRAEKRDTFSLALLDHISASSSNSSIYDLSWGSCFSNSCFLFNVSTLTNKAAFSASKLSLIECVVDCPECLLCCDPFSRYDETSEMLDLLSFVSCCALVCIFHSFVHCGCKINQCCCVWAIPFNLILFCLLSR